MPKLKEHFIEPEDILSAEFAYIAETANQANEDRATVVSFFLIAVGSPLAAFFTTDLLGSSDQIIYNLFSGLFFILTVLGTTTILQLARLRAAWYESMMAMNQMKEFLINKSELDISGAFRWRAGTAPPKFKVNSVGFYQALEVAILSGLLFGAFIFFLLNGLQVPNLKMIRGLSIGLGLLNIVFQLYLYRRFVK